MPNPISTLVTHGVTIANSGANSYTSPLTITSSGTVDTGTGVAVSSSLTNAVLDNQGLVNATGSYVGVNLSAGGTVINSGTISGGNGTAVSFGGTGGNLLVLDPGYHLGGLVVGSTTVGATNTLELGSTGNAGTLSAALDYEFVHFGTITVDAGAQWTLTNTSTLGVGVTLTDLGTLANAGTLTGLASLIVNAATFSNSGYLGLTATLSGGGYLTNASTGTIGYAGTGVFGSGTGTVVNRGTIGAYKYGPPTFGVYFSASGGVSNLGASALIEGLTGVAIYNAPGTVTNSGVILGTGNLDEAVYLTGGGTVANNGGQITGFIGVDISGGAGLVTNAGTITGTSIYGIRLQTGGTIIDSGSVSGANGTAVYFGGNGSNLLVLENGFSLSGVYGLVGSTNTVELAGTVSAAVTANYSGLGLTHFSEVLFGSGGHDTLQVGITSSTLPVTLSGFIANTETVDLTGLSGATLGNGGTVNGSDQLVVSNGAQTVTLQLDGSDATVFTASPDGGSGTDVTPACYCRGTLILTERGEVPVEDLAIGDRVTTISGEAMPIRWIGHRAYDSRFVAGNRGILPIRVAAGALAEDTPARDLWVSPGHSLYIEGVLVQSEHLVNGATIVQEESVEEIEYFHIEIDSHNILFADGAPAESYVDCDNRLMFENGAGYAALHPDDDRPTWEFCVPKLGWDSPELEAIRAGVLARAEALGHAIDFDPDLHLVVDGVIIRPDSVGGDVHRFVVPGGGAAVWLASRTSAPAEVNAASRDTRRLGVPVTRLALGDGELTVEAWHGHAALSEGFHQDEDTHRWTDGRARLPDAWLRLFPGAFTLEVGLGGGWLPYRLSPPARTRAAA